MRLRLGFSLILCTLASACTDSSQNRDRHAQLQVFGTVIDVRVEGATEDEFESAVGDANTLLQSMHRRWHPWEQGLNVQINTAIASGHAIALDKDARSVIALAQQYAGASDHLFNPAAGKLVAMWGFHTSNYPITSPAPSDQLLQEWLEATPTMEDVALEGTELSSSNRHVQLDLSGFVKGLAVDRVIAELQRRGFKAALVNAGGDLRAYGQRADGWRVGIASPTSQTPLAVITLQGDESAFTSGNYTRYREGSETRQSHILDPRTGKPVSNVAAVTVLMSAGAAKLPGAIADAGATALMVAGKSQFVPIAKSMGLEHALMIDEQGCVLLNQGLSARIAWRDKPDCIEIVPDWN